MGVEAYAIDASEFYGLLVFYEYRSDLSSSLFAQLSFLFNEQ